MFQLHTFYFLADNLEKQFKLRKTFAGYICKDLRLYLAQDTLLS